MSTTPTHHDVLVLGAGNAGTALAAQALRAGAPDVALVDPAAEHTYRPLLSYVAAGLAASSYVGGTEARAWERLRGTTRGTVVFMLPPEPTSCGPTALKPLLMACDHWRREGVLGAVRPVLLTAGDPTGVRELDPYVRRALDDYGVEVHGGRPRAPRGRRRAAAGARHDGGPGGRRRGRLRAPRAAVPPPDVLAGLLGGPDGLVDVDPQTLRHRHHPQVWAVGDCATTLNLHSGAALRTQVPVLVHNLQAARKGRPLRHDAGYSAAPVTVSRDRLCFAEVGPDGSRQQAVPYADLFAPRRSTFLLDRHLLPRLYWRGILPGRL